MRETVLDFRTVELVQYPCVMVSAQELWSWVAEAVMHDQPADGYYVAYKGAEIVIR